MISVAVKSGTVGLIAEQTVQQTHPPFIHLRCHTGAGDGFKYPCWINRALGWFGTLVRITKGTFKLLFSNRSPFFPRGFHEFIRESTAFVF